MIPIKITKPALDKIKQLIKKKKNKEKKLRIYIIGGGCRGFKYGFTLEKKINQDDYLIYKEQVSIIIDPISLQYLTGGSIDYIEELKGSRFVISNPHAKTTCSCGDSFSI